MKEFFWSVFEKSGSIDAFLAYSDYNKYEMSAEIAEDDDKKD